MEDYYYVDHDDEKSKDYSPDWWRVISAKVKSTITSATTSSTSPNNNKAEMDPACESCASSESPASSPSSSISKAPQPEEAVYDDDYDDSKNGYHGEAIQAYTSSRTVVHWKQRAVRSLSSPILYGKTKDKTE